MNGGRPAWVATRQAAADQFDYVDGNDRNLTLIVGVKMRSMVRYGRLCKHPDDDPKEATNLGHRAQHSSTLLRTQHGHCTFQDVRLPG